ncbi:MAG TPA: diguanylate cyclase, partial [Candidatus Dormibacteraeota bacterium]
EAAVLYEARGAAVFSAGFAAAFAAVYWERLHFFGFPVEIGSLVFRTTTVLLVAAFMGAMSTQSQGRRRELERRAAALRASEERLRRILDTTSIGVSVADSQGRILSANSAYQRLVGYDEAELTRMRIIDFTHPDDVGADIVLAAEVASGVRTHGQVEKRWLRKDGEVRWVRINASHMPVADGGPGRVVAIVEDITERRLAEGRLQRTSGLQTMQFAVTRCLAEAGTLDDAAPRFLESIAEPLRCDAASLFLTGADGHTLTLHHSWRAPGALESDPAALTVLAAEALDGSVRSHGRTVAVPIAHEGTTTGVVVLAGSREPEVAGDILAVLADIGSQVGQFVERKAAETALAESAARLVAIAATDPLTGLPNRREFEQILAADQPLGFAVLAIDVDNLKVINDGYGHEAGDAALRAIATALRMGLREPDVVARNGGDEFAALLPDTDLDMALRVADRLRRAMHGIALPHGQARISIGCAAGPPGADASAVFTTADEALYRAKRAGRDRLEADLHAVTAAGARRVRWETMVPSLLREDGITSVFQPIVRLHDGAVIGYEALGRPSGETVDGGVEGLFAAAERVGEARNLDWMCRRAALLACSGLPDAAALFVNVGVSLLLDPLHDVDQMLLLLRWAGRPASAVVLEITEREAVSDLERLRAVVTEYRRHGFRFALDDVGTGHSTLEVLSVVTPEFVKVAGALTRRPDEKGPRSAIRALVAFAESSGAQVIAEEVENPDTAAAMAELGVGLGQGFMWGMPAAAATWH